MSKSDKKPHAPKSCLPSQRLNRKTVPCIDGATPEETALNFANLMISPEMASFRVITNRERRELMEQLDTPALIEALRQQTKTVHKGDLRAAEAMLMNQATALQSLFVKLAETGLQADLLRSAAGTAKLARYSHSCSPIHWSDSSLLPQNGSGISPWRSRSVCTQPGTTAARQAERRVTSRNDHWAEERETDGMGGNVV